MDTTVRRPALTLAALASAGAGLVHAAAAGTHQDERTLVVLFSLCALAQLAWAMLALVRPRRWVVLVGGLLNVAAVSTWVLSRTTGLPLVDALRDQEAVGRQDLVAAVLGGIAVLGCAATLLWPRTTRTLAPAFVAGLGVCALAGAYIGVAAPHGRGVGEEHAHGGEIAARSATEPHGHSTAEGTDGTTASSGQEHHAVPEQLDHEPTEEQQADAEELIADTARELRKYADVNDAIAAGYQSIGDGRSGVEHFINAAYTANATILDATQPESLVYRIEPDGAKTLTTAMYILPPGSTMDDVPDVAGNLTVWHDHQNLCFAPGTNRLAGVAVNGRCRPAGELRATAPMLHVWIVDNPCGPFAGTDANQMTGSCTH